MLHHSILYINHCLGCDPSVCNPRFAPETPRDGDLDGRLPSENPFCIARARSYVSAFAQELHSLPQGSRCSGYESLRKLVSPITFVQLQCVGGSRVDMLLLDAMYRFKGLATALQLSSVERYACSQNEL